jgi:hypothetical protein
MAMAGHGTAAEVMRCLRRPAFPTSSLSSTALPIAFLGAGRDLDKQGMRLSNPGQGPMGCRNGRSQQDSAGIPRRSGEPRKRRALSYAWAL